MKDHNFKVNDVQIVGNRYITTESLRERLELKPGDTFDGTIMRRDVGELTYGYGELGFIYAEVEPQTVMRDEANEVDLIYKIVRRRSMENRRNPGQHRRRTALDARNDDAESDRSARRRFHRSTNT